MVFREPGGASFLFPSHADCDHLSHAGCDHLSGRRLPLRYFCSCPLLGGLYTNLLGFAVVCLVCCSVFFLKAPALPIVPTDRSASHLMPWRIFAHAMMPHCSLRSISPMWMSSPEMEACRPKGLLPPSPGPLGPGPGPLPPNGLWVLEGRVVAAPHLPSAFCCAGGPASHVESCRSPPGPGTGQGEHSDSVATYSRCYWRWACHTHRTARALGQRSGPVHHSCSQCHHCCAFATRGS